MLDFARHTFTWDYRLYKGHSSSCKEQHSRCLHAAWCCLSSVIPSLKSMCRKKTWWTKAQVEAKFCPSSTSFRAKCLEYVVRTNIHPYYKNQNEDTSGKYLNTRIIIKLQIKNSCVREQMHEIYLAIKRVLWLEILFDLHMNLHSFHFSLRWMVCSWKLIYPSVSVHTELTLWPESAKPWTFSAKVMKGTLMLPLPTLDIWLPLPKLFWHLSSCLPHAHNCDIPPSIPLFSCHGYIQHGIGTSAGPFCHCVAALYRWQLQCICTNSQSCL